jgi:hypothetical protein
MIPKRSLIFASILFEIATLESQGQLTTPLQQNLPYFHGLASIAVCIKNARGRFHVQIGSKLQLGSLRRIL